MHPVVTGHVRDVLIVCGDGLIIAGRSAVAASDAVPCPVLKAGGKMAAAAGRSMVDSADKVCPRSIEIAERPC